VNHENIVQLVELFYEEVDSFKSCLTLITTDINESLDVYLENAKDPFSKLVNFKESNFQELIDLMMQLLSGLQKFHNLKHHFEIGELSEKTIYFSTLYSNLYIDPGFYFDDIDCPGYFEPPEKKASQKSDIFAMGMIFFRLLTMISSEEASLIISSQIQKKPTFLSKIKETLNVQPTYYQNIKQALMGPEQVSFLLLISSKETYGSDIVEFILGMVDSNPENRKSVDELMETLKNIRTELNKMVIRSRKKVVNKYNQVEKAQMSLILDDKNRKYFKAFLR
jgi:serine/threonine protein kinase